MKKYNIIYLFMLVFAFVACDKDELLDIQPYGVSIPSSVDDYRKLLDNRQGSGDDLGRTPSYDTDLLMGDEIKFPTGTLSGFIDWSGNTRAYDALQWAEKFGGPTENDSDWDILYNHVYLMNVIKEKLEDSETTGSDAEKEQMIAECKVHRAYAYFSLINLYSKQYDPSSAASDIGVPLKLSPEFGNYESKTVEEVYAAILTDLNEAIASTNLPSEVPSYNWRSSKTAAYAMLARTYLQMGNYAEAKSAADHALALHNQLLDYNNIFYLPYGFENPEVMLLKERSDDTASTKIYASDEQIAIYDAADKRLELHFGLDWYTGAYLLPVTYSEVDYYMGPGTPEMLLIRAECNARDGNVGDAIADLNTLREKRIASYTALTTTDLPDAQTALDFVKEERRREMVAKGMRLFDLKRYNLLDNANISLTHVTDAGTFTLEPNSNRWIVPIVQLLLDKSPEIGQRPR